MQNVLSLQRLSSDPLDPCRNSGVSCDSSESCDSWISGLEVT